MRNEEWGISHLVTWSSGLKDTFQRNLIFSDWAPPSHFEVLRREWGGRDTDTTQFSFNLFPLLILTFLFLLTSFHPTTLWWRFSQGISVLAVMTGRTENHKHESTNEKPCCVNATSILFRDSLNLVPISALQKEWVILPPLFFCVMVSLSPLSWPLTSTQTACPEPALSHCLWDRHGYATGCSHKLSFMFLFSVFFRPPSFFCIVTLSSHEILSSKVLMCLSSNSSIWGFWRIVCLFSFFLISYLSLPLSALHHPVEASVN